MSPVGALGEPGMYGPAGVVTRVLAAVVDTAVVTAAQVGVYVGIAGLQFIWSPRSFSWPQSPPTLTGGLAAGLAIAYLTVSWATTGRTYGGALLGLRVLSVNRSLLGWPRSAVRAILCVLFPIGLLWAAFSGSRRSLQDSVLRSVVIYDWNRDGGLRASASFGMGECATASVTDADVDPK